MTSVDYTHENHANLSLPQAADRIAIRDLVDAYARCADRRDAAGQMALFTEDTDYEVYEDLHSTEPTQSFRGRAALAPVFEDLKKYDVTTHRNGESTIVLDDGQAFAETYCPAHLLKADGPARTLMIASIRYLDTFVKNDGVWLISRRNAMVNWTESRPLTGAAAS